MSNCYRTWTRRPHRISRHDETISEQWNRATRKRWRPQNSPEGVPMRVKSWSMNWPKATNIMVAACSWKPSSGCIVLETTLAGGSCLLLTLLDFGPLMPSENSGPTNLENGTLDAPHVGCLTLLHSPSYLLYLPGLHSTFDKNAGHTSLINVFDVSICGNPFSTSSYESS